MPDDTFVFRPIRELEHAAVLDFGQRTWGADAARRVRESWWLTSDHAHALAAVDQASGRIAGMVVGVPSAWPVPGGSGLEPTISICGWYVAPDFAGKGLGKLLVRSFEPAATALNTLSISEAAIRNFSKLGWTGPFRSQLLLLPLPGWRRRPKGAGKLSLRRFTICDGHVAPALAEALDQIEAERPSHVFRRARPAAAWRSHLSVRPGRTYRFSIIDRAGMPIGMFASRAGDSQAGRMYRMARLHYLCDVVLNAADPAARNFLAASLGPASPRDAGALLFCTTRADLAEALGMHGWLDRDSPVIGPRLAEKAPQYMLAARLGPLPGDQAELTFSDSDVDLNI